MLTNVEYAEGTLLQIRLGSSLVNVGALGQAIEWLAPSMDHFADK